MSTKLSTLNETKNLRFRAISGLGAGSRGASRRSCGVGPSVPGAGREAISGRAGLDRPARFFSPVIFARTHRRFPRRYKALAFALGGGLRTHRRATEARLPRSPSRWPAPRASRMEAVPPLHVARRPHGVPGGFKQAACRGQW